MATIGPGRFRSSLNAYLFLAPLLVFYTLFMVYPFFRNFWISLHDWNLLEVAFNPDAREFVGARNYIRTAWGRRMEWGIGELKGLQFSCIAMVFLLAWGYLRRGWSLATLLGGSVFLVIVFVALGFTPSTDGRWYDKRFWIAVRNTFVFVVASVPLITAIGLMLAVLLNYPNRIMGFFRTLFYLSSVLSVTVITLIWTYMFSPFQGLIANIGRTFGAEPVFWITSPNLAMAAIVIATVWWVIGFPMIVFLAGLQEIPAERYEAARIDGANAWKLFWHITVPGLRRPIVFVLLYEVISQFQIFGQAHLITDGGPGDSTNTLIRYIYNTGFRDNELGKAGTMAVFLFLFMAIFSFIYLRLSTRSADE